MDFILILCSFTAIVSVVNDVYVDLTTVGYRQKATGQKATDRRPLRQKATGQKATERNVKMLPSCQDVLERLRMVFKKSGTNCTLCFICASM